MNTILISQDYHFLQGPEKLKQIVNNMKEMQRTVIEEGGKAVFIGDVIDDTYTVHCAKGVIKE